MCGIAIIISEDELKVKNFLTDSVIKLNHRGPDSNGVWLDSNCGMAHTRLSILDLTSAGAQPMQSESQRYVISYNGEIYNHLALRKKHFPDKRDWKSHSDTETILALFEKLQHKMLSELTGMWAFGIWDRFEKTLFVSRDRYGQKPLYFRYEKNEWLFASEIAPLLKNNEQNLCNKEAVIELLASGNYGHLRGETFFKDIKELEPAHFAYIQLNRNILKLEKYWELPEIPLKEQMVFDHSIKTELHDRVVEAVLSQTLSDVPIGLTLSGGIDSSVIAGILFAHYGNPIEIFTAQTSGSTYDESKFVNAVLKDIPPNKYHLNQLELSTNNLFQDLDHAIRVQEEPFGDPSIIAHLKLMGMASDKGIKVILGGQGADEIFFGYDSLVKPILANQFKNLNWLLFFKNLGEIKIAPSSKIRLLVSALLPKFEKIVAQKLRSGRNQKVQQKLGWEKFNTSFIQADQNNRHQVWEETTKGIHLPHLVHYDDRNGMSKGVEGRMPFLDHRIAETLAKIRWSEFIKNGQRKYLLREACRDYLPKVLYNRKDKIGFYTPLSENLNSAKIHLTDRFSKNINLNNKILTANFIELINNKEHNYLEILYLWRIICILIWEEEFRINLR